MIQVQRKALKLVTRGKDFVIRGQYDNAKEAYHKSLEYLPDYYLTRNGIGELMFINKEYIAAAENFYLAAVDEVDRMDLNILTLENISSHDLLVKKEELMKEVTQLLNNYTYKSGLALYAHQYDNPIEKTPRQAAINCFRNEVDPCGYSGFTEADADLLVDIEKEVKSVGTRFLRTMNKKTEESTQTAPKLSFLVDFIDV